MLTFWKTFKHWFATCVSYYINLTSKDRLYTYVINSPSGNHIEINWDKFTLSNIEYLHMHLEKNASAEQVKRTLGHDCKMLNYPVESCNHFKLSDSIFRTSNYLVFCNVMCIIIAYYVYGIMIEPTSFKPWVLRSLYKNKNAQPGYCLIAFIWTNNSELNNDVSNIWGRA